MGSPYERGTRGSRRARHSLGDESWGEGDWGPAGNVRGETWPLAASHLADGHRCYPGSAEAAVGLVERDRNVVGGESGSLRRNGGNPGDCRREAGRHPEGAMRVHMQHGDLAEPAGFREVACGSDSW